MLSNNIPISTLHNAVKAINEGRQSSGFGGPRLFSDDQEDTLYCYIVSSAEHGEPMTRTELIALTSDLLKTLRPELTKTNTQYQRECSASGGEKIATDYGPISHKWIKGFFERMEKRHHIKMNECHAEMLEVNRAEIATDQIRENQDEFRGLAHKLGIDIDTVAGR